LQALYGCDSTKVAACGWLKGTGLELDMFLGLPEVKDEASEKEAKKARTTCNWCGKSAGMACPAYDGSRQ